MHLGIEFVILGFYFPVHKISKPPPFYSPPPQAWALFVLLLSTLVCCQPTKLIGAFFFCFIHFTLAPLGPSSILSSIPVIVEWGLDTHPAVLNQALASRIDQAVSMKSGVGVLHHSMNWASLLSQNRLNFPTNSR